MGKHPVTIAADWTLPMISVHMNIHVPAPPPPGVSYPHAEVPVPIYYAPGRGQHKLTFSVFHQGMPIAQDGHDCGHGIIHLCYPPNNVLLLAHNALSKRKTVFGASTVNMNGAQTGLIGGWCPMLMCADPLSLPLQWAPTNASNTVFVGSTAGDLYGGWAGIAVNALIEAIIYRAAKALAHLISNDETVQLALDYLFKALMKWLFPYTMPSKWVKKRVQEWVDAPSSSAAVSPTGTSVTAFSTPSPFGEATIEVGQSGDGSFVATTSSPTSSGGRSERRHDNLTLFGHGVEEEREDGLRGLGNLFRKAPAL